MTENTNFLKNLHKQKQDRLKRENEKYLRLKNEFIAAEREYEAIKELLQDDLATIGKELDGIEKQKETNADPKKAVTYTALLTRDLDHEMRQKLLDLGCSHISPVETYNTKKEQIVFQSNRPLEQLEAITLFKEIAVQPLL